jgi:hypothetical protein
MLRINDVHERKVFEAMSVLNYRATNMNRKPVEQLYNLRRDYDSFIAHQSPYKNSYGLTQWSDFSVYKRNECDIRVEVSSLAEISDLSCRVYRLLRESKTMPEKLLILVLLDKGYNNPYVLRGIYDMIKSDQLPVKIIKTIDDYYGWITQYKGVN